LLKQRQMVEAGGELAGRLAAIGMAENMITTMLKNEKKTAALI